MPLVVIAYDEDLSKIGSQVEVSQEEASALISMGRARLGPGLPAPDESMLAATALPAPSATGLDLTEADDELVEHDGD